MYLAFPGFLPFLPHFGDGLLIPSPYDCPFCFVREDLTCGHLHIPVPRHFHFHDSICKWSHCSQGTEENGNLGMFKGLGDS